MQGHVVVFVAKEIVTMNPTWPSAQVVAVQDGRIVGVGRELKDLDAWLQRPGVTHTIDRTYEGAVLLPGFIEQHNHPLIGGSALSLPSIAHKPMPTPFGAKLRPINSKAEAIESMRATSRASPPGEDVVFWGWDIVAMGGHLRSKDLDEVDTTRAVVVWDCSLHVGYTNSFAIAKLRLSPAKCGKVNGVELDAEGNLSGAFIGVDALQCILPFFSKLMHPKRALESLHYITELGREHGITTMCELMHGGVNLLLEGALYKQHFKNKTTPMRCVVVCDAAKVLTSCLGSERWAVSWLRRQQLVSSEKLIFNNGIKFFTDDAFLGLTMCLGFPGYSDGHKGLWNCGPRGSRYAAKMLPWWKAGCRIHVHSNGDAAQDATAEALAMLQRVCPRFDHRFCVEHYAMSALHLHRKLKNLGASVAVNSYYVHHRADLNVPALGRDRAHGAAQLRSIVDVGLPLALHTDTPVAPPNPLEEIWTAVNRRSDGGQDCCPDERVTPYQALKMKTVDAAYVHGLDGLLGSIEAGKLADFVALDASPLAVAPEKIRDIKVLGTVVGGVKFAHEPLKSQVPKPPPGLVGPLLWLLGETAEGAVSRWVWRRLAQLSGCGQQSTAAA